MKNRTLIRLVFLSISFVLAGFSARDSAVAYWRNQATIAYDQGHAPEGLPAYFAHDPAIEVLAYQLRISTSTSPLTDLFGIVSSADAALRRNPLNPGALYNLGKAAEARKAGSGQALFKLGEQISRREALNEIALEQSAAQNNDVEGAITHIDRIVSVVPDFAAKIFPSMVPALADPDVRNNFMRYAQRRWYPDLIAAALGRGGDPDAIAKMISAGAPFQRAAVVQQEHSGLMATVMNTGNFEAASRLISALPGRSRHALDGLGFSQDTTDSKLAPLAWALTNDGTARAQLGQGSTLEISITADKIATAAVRTTLFQPGTYQLTQVISYTATAPHAGLTWFVTCAGASPKVIWHQPVPTTGADTVTYRSAITIPPECGGQIWELRANGDTGQFDSEASVHDLVLARQ